MNHDSAQTAHPLIEAHRTLMDAIEALESEIPHGSLAQLKEMLGFVRAQILEHFRLEEQGGYMKQVLDQSPYRERVVAKLLHEHGVLGTALDSILKDPESAAETSQIKQRIEEWILQVRRHESQENALVEETFSSDIGTKD